MILIAQQACAGAVGSSLVAAMPAELARTRCGLASSGKAFASVPVLVPVSATAPEFIAAGEDINWATGLFDAELDAADA